MHRAQPRLIESGVGAGNGTDPIRYLDPARRRRGARRIVTGQQKSW